MISMPVYVLLHKGEIVAMFSTDTDPVILRTIIIKVRNLYPEDYNPDDFFRELEYRRIKYKRYKPNREMILYF